MKTIRKILEKIYNDPYLRENCIPCFLGNPGIGKTTEINNFAKEKGVNLLKFVTSHRQPNEISGMYMPENGKMVVYDSEQFLSLKDGDIIFFDEIFNANPLILDSCLTILEERTLLSGKKLPKVMIVAASNPQGMVYLKPQVKERFIFYDIKFDIDVLRKALYWIPLSLINMFASKIESSKFDPESLTYFSMRSMIKNVYLYCEGIENNLYTNYFNNTKHTIHEDITDNGKIVWYKNTKVSIGDIIKYYYDRVKK